MIHYLTKIAYNFINNRVYFTETTTEQKYAYIQHG